MAVAREQGSPGQRSARTLVLEYPEILRVLEQIDLIPLIEAGFVEFSRGRVVVPPVGEMIFEDGAGDSHIKFGFVRGGSTFVVKVANYFPGNAARGLEPDDGMVTLYDMQSGAVRALLLDRGHLTRVRTAAAGAVAARYLAPRKVERIGIIGTGVQARLQLKYLASVTACRDVCVFGRDRKRVDAYRNEMKATGYSVEAADSPSAVTASCNLIVTCTPAQQPLLSVEDFRPGMHITAMGSDSADKNEIDPRILAAADIVAVDSVQHASAIGELHHALDAGLLARSAVRELGQIIQEPTLGRTSEDQRTIADLVGLAVQDIQAANAVCTAFAN